MTDNQAGTLLLSLCLLDGFANLVDIVAVNLLHIPSPSLILLGGVLAGYHFCLGRQLNIVGIIEHDEVVQSEVTGNTACALGNLFLYATVRDVGIDGLVHDVAQTSLQEFGSDGCTHSERVSLTEGTAGVLDAAFNLALGVTGRHRTPLAQVLQILQRVLADEGELAVKHGSHVAGVEEETVATFPSGVLRVVDQKFAVECVDEISAAHSTTGVSRLSLFNHRSSKDTDVVRCHVHYFVVVHKIKKSY